MSCDWCGRPVCENAGACERALRDEEDMTTLRGAEVGQTYMRRERELFADALRAFLYSEDALDVTGSFGFTPPIGDDFREKLIAAATPHKAPPRTGRLR